MILKRLELTNFKCFPDVVAPSNSNEILPQGLHLIQGVTPEKSNSFGKSSLVEGIMVGIFGPEASTLKIDDLITYGKEQAEIKVAFEVDGVDYLIQRTFKRKGNKKHIENIFVKKGGKLIPDTTISIPAILQIDVENAMKTVFVRQGEIESLARASPAELRDMIVDLFHLDIASDAIAYLKEIQGKADSRINEIQRVFVPPERLQAEIDEKQVELENESINLEKRMQELKTAETELGALPKRETLKKVEQIKRDIEFKKARLDDVNSKLAKQRSMINPSINEKNIADIIETNNASIAKLKLDRKGKDAEKNEKSAEKGKFTGIISMIETNKKQLKSRFKFENGRDKSKCPTCYREISIQEANRLISEWDAEIKRNQSIVDKINSEYKMIEKEIEIIDEKIATIDAVNRVLVEYNKLIEEKNTITRDLDTSINLLADSFKALGVASEQELVKRYGVSSLDMLKEKIAVAETTVQTARGMVENSNTAIEALKAQVEKYRKEMEKMKNLSAERDSLSKRIRHIEKNKDLVKAFITEYMVEKCLIVNIQHTTNKFLSYFTGGQYSSINMTSVKDGKGISLSVYDEYAKISKDVSEGKISGGDRVALGFALRIGISQLMTRIRPTKDSPKLNPKVNFMILDEPLAALDEERRAQILTTLENQKEFTQIFLITHTSIPEGINPHTFKISKNTQTGLSTITFQQKSTMERTIKEE
ncbi:MAG: hypothetical protein Q6373_014060 [Candidatus Sigynarchaeota archaeon]